MGIDGLVATKVVCKPLDVRRALARLDELLAVPAVLMPRAVAPDSLRPMSSTRP